MKKLGTGLIVFAAGLITLAVLGTPRHRLHALELRDESPRVHFSWNRDAYAAGDRLELFHAESLTGRWHLISTTVVDAQNTNASYLLDQSMLSLSSGFFTVHKFEDADGDGISDAREELEFQSDPLSLDSDGDGFPDAEEVARGMDPANTDSDRDGISDAFEAIFGTDPTDPDTDHDGLTDAEERNDYMTDPLRTDTDCDGLSDLAEVRFGSDPLNDFSINSRYQDRAMYLMQRRDPMEINAQSGCRAWEHVFYGGSPDAKFELPQSTERLAVLKLKVTGSDYAYVKVGDKERVAFGPGGTEPSELLISLERGREYNVTLEPYGNIKVEFTSDDFMYGEMPTTGGDGIWKAWFGFPNIVATRPCIHRLSEQSVEVKLEPGSVTYGFTCTWMPTAKITVQNHEPFSATLSGNMQRGNIEEVTYQLGHANYICGNRLYHQQARYCPDDCAEEESGGISSYIEMERQEGDGDTSGNEWKEYMDYDDLNDYPEQENVLKLHNPTESLPIWLEVEKNRTFCCECPDHCSNFVEVAQLDYRLSLTDGSGQPFERTAQDCRVRVTGVSPSKEVGDAKLSFNRNGKTYQPAAYTVLGLGIECRTWDQEVLELMGEEVGIPVGVCGEHYSVALTDICPIEPSGVGIRLNTDIDLPSGMVKLEFLNATAHVELLLARMDGEKRYWFRLLDSRFKSCVSMKIDDWKQRIGNGDVKLVAFSAGTADLRFSYGAACNDKALKDEVYQRITALSARLMFDYERDGRIDNVDEKMCANDETFRFWINDDSDAEEVEEGLADLPGAGTNCEDDRVNGPRDLVDFATMCVDLTEVYDCPAISRLKGCLHWRLVSDCINVLPSDLPRQSANCFQFEDVGARFGHEMEDDIYHARVESLKKGYVLNDRLTMNATKTGGYGVLLIEGCKSGGEIRLEGWLETRQGEVKLMERTVKISLSSVNDMYHWLSLRGDEAKVEYAKNKEEVKWVPRNIVFVHGFNVNEQEARAWAAEMFKRFWQTGYMEHFTAVDWYGDSSQFHSRIKDDNYAPDYYVNVRNAFDAARRLPEAMDLLPGYVVMLGHSLGNVLVSAAAADFGLKYERYYMLNAAVPMEAYDGTAYASEMVDPEWAKVPTAYWACNWSSLFGPDDFRYLLSWRGRFAGLHDAVNCYSETEDVLKNAEPGQLLYSGSAWKIQELAKGTTTWYDLNALSLGGLDIVCEGGWGINAKYALNPRCYLYQYGFTSWASEELTREQAITEPLFTPFKVASRLLCQLDPLYLYQVPDAEPLRARLLADAIPATSFAAGANRIEALGGANNCSLIDLADNLSSWPESRTSSSVREWRHSDIKNLPYLHVHRLFEKILKGN